MDWKTHRAELLKDPKVKKAWKESRLEYEITRSVIRARIEQDLT